MSRKKNGWRQAIIIRLKNAGTAFGHAAIPNHVTEEGRKRSWNSFGATSARRQIGIMVQDANAGATVVRIIEAAAMNETAIQAILRSLRRRILRGVEAGLYLLN